MGAPINLKDLTIRIEDATSMTGTVNNGAGYSAGASTAVVDGFVGEDVFVGSKITFASHATVYTVTARTFGSDTTSITFTPVLTAGIADNEVITVGPNFVDVVVGEGTMDYTEKRNVTYYKDRGVLDTTREGDDEPVELNLDFKFDHLVSESGEVVPTVEEAIKFTGPAANWVAANNATCSTPKSVNISVLETPPCTGVDNQLFFFENFCYETLAHDFKAGSVKMTGKCNVTQATITRDV